jgi:hypothetical protein
MEASSSGTLVIENTLTNTNGIVEALNGGTVLLNGATVSGGILTTTGTGSILGEASALLDGLAHTVTLSSGSSLQVPNNNTTLIQGTLTNNGTLTLNSAGNGTFLDLASGQNATLTGTGIVTLSNNSQNFIQGASSASQTLTNQQTIQGSGNIGNGQMTLVNSGTINATMPPTLWPSMLRVQEAAARLTPALWRLRLGRNWFWTAASPTRGAPSSPRGPVPKSC